MKKTAVEWLAQKLFKINSSSTTDMDGTIKFLAIEFKDLFEQAKEMEKEQIIECYQNGSIDTLKDELKFGKQYYNEQFKNK
jgi:hypothetical protein